MQHFFLTENIKEQVLILNLFAWFILGLADISSLFFSFFIFSKYIRCPNLEGMDYQWFGLVPQISLMLLAGLTWLVLDLKYFP